MRRALIALVALVALAQPASAQRVNTRFEDEPEGESLAVEIGKWASGGLALAAGAYAFVIQNDAEDALEDLERFCDEQPVACATDGDGVYVDDDLESDYQDIRGDYRTSRWLLIGSQALVVTSIVLFIIDMPRNATPDNEPYDPPALRVGRRADGAVEASFSYPVSNILTRSP